PPTYGGPHLRVSSPVGDSTFMTSAPMSARSWVQYGPARTLLRSRTLTFFSILASLAPGTCATFASNQLGRNRMRTGLRSIIAVAALGLGIAFAQIPLSIATGGTGGVYYPTGGGYAQVIDQFVDGYTATVEATNASVDNVAFISRGDADLALALADTVLAAYQGTGDFGEGGTLPQLPNLRAITVAYTNAVHVITRADSGIDSLQDLVGKRVSVGAPGSGTEVSAQTILEAVGISYDDFTVQRLGANETA